MLHLLVLPSAFGELIIIAGRVESPPPFFVFFYNTKYVRSKKGFFFQKEGSK